MKAKMTMVLALLVAMIAVCAAVVSAPDTDAAPSYIATVDADNAVVSFTYKDGAFTVTAVPEEGFHYGQIDGDECVITVTVNGTDVLTYVDSKLSINGVEQAEPCNPVTGTNDVYAYTFDLSAYTQLPIQIDVVLAPIEATEYSITYTPSVDYFATLDGSDMPVSAIAGETLEFIVVPPTGETITSVVYYVDGGRPVTIEPIEGVYIFDMPLGNIEIEALTTLDNYYVNVPDETAEYVTIDGIDNPYHFGDEVTFTVTPNDGYEFGEDFRVFYLDPQGSEVVISSIDGIFSFEMPDYDVDLLVDGLIPHEYTITVGDHPVPGSEIEVQPSATVGTAVPVEVLLNGISIVDANDMLAISIYYFDETGAKVELDYYDLVAEDNLFDDKFYFGTNYYFYFDMPAADVTIEITDSTPFDFFYLIIIDPYPEAYEGEDQPVIEADDPVVYHVFKVPYGFKEFLGVISVDTTGRIFGGYWTYDYSELVKLVFEDDEPGIIVNTLAYIKWFDGNDMITVTYSPNPVDDESAEYVIDAYAYGNNVNYPNDPSEYFSATFNSGDLIAVGTEAVFEYYGPLQAWIVNDALYYVDDELYTDNVLTLNTADYPDGLDVQVVDELYHKLTIYYYNEYTDDVTAYFDFVEIENVMVLTFVQDVLDENIDLYDLAMYAYSAVPNEYVSVEGQRVNVDTTVYAYKTKAGPDAYWDVFDENGEHTGDLEVLVVYGNGNLYRFGDVKNSDFPDAPWSILAGTIKYIYVLGDLNVLDHELGIIPNYTSTFDGNIDMVIEAYDGLSPESEVAAYTGITTVGSYSFYGLTEVIGIYMGNTVTTIQTNGFNGIKNVETIVISEGLKTSHQWAFDVYFYDPESVDALDGSKGTALADQYVLSGHVFEKADYRNLVATVGFGYTGDVYWSYGLDSEIDYTVGFTNVIDNTVYVYGAGAMADYNAITGDLPAWTFFDCFADSWAAIIGGDVTYVGDFAFVSDDQFDCGVGSIYFEASETPLYFASACTDYRVVSDLVTGYAHYVTVDNELVGTIASFENFRYAFLPLAFDDNMAGHTFYLDIWEDVSGGYYNHFFRCFDDIEYDCGVNGDDVTAIVHFVNTPKNTIDITLTFVSNGGSEIANFKKAADAPWNKFEDFNKNYDGNRQAPYVDGITHIFFDDSITAIGAKLFYGYLYIETVTFPMGLLDSTAEEAVADNAFQGCLFYADDGTLIYLSEDPELLAGKTFAFTGVGENNRLYGEFKHLLTIEADVPVYLADENGVFVIKSDENVDGTHFMMPRDSFPGDVWTLTLKIGNKDKSYPDADYDATIAADQYQLVDESGAVIATADENGAFVFDMPKADFKAKLVLIE
ncbi:MAG: leucine-rich repeat domain-containing protein [archaeon]|nr:leucine-rich repeat domain-containing protein [archaeon]